MTPGELAVLVGVILGPTGIWGLRELRGRRNAAIKIVDPGPPAPATVMVTPDPQVIALQSQISALTNLLGDLAARVDTLERERDAAVRSESQAAAMAAAAHERELMAVEHAKRLHLHIVSGGDPPGPDWPTGWIH